MWSSRFFWKLFLTYTALNLTATMTFVVIVVGWQQQQVVDQIKQRLHDSATLVRSNIADVFPLGQTQELQARVIRLGQEIDTRITLVAIDGTVLADSEKSRLSQVQEMENHKDRLELVRAATLGTGTSQRTSPTLGERMLYVAIRIDGESAPLGLVRTALPMTEVLSQVAAIQRLIWSVAGLVSVSVVMLTYYLAARVVRPVRILTDAAESIAAGDYRHSVFLQTRDELGTLAESFNRMSRQLEGRELELQESSQRLKAVLEGMVEGVIALDGRERIVLANAAAGRLLGFVPADVGGRTLLEVVRNRAIHEAIGDNDQGSRRVEIELGGEDGRVIGVNATMLSTEPSTRCILVLHDVTELRRLESLRQEFVANVSHELKTPLSSIKAYAETLLDGAIHDPNNNTRFVRRIEEQAERLHELILDLLSIAQIESGQQAFEIVAVNLEVVVRACLSEHQAAAESRNIAIDISGELSGVHVRADEEGLRQILNNLVDNALKYTADGGQVRVACRPAGSAVFIEVRDTGIGISAKYLPRVFERFYRVDKARSRELGGTGLGLSIVKHLAQSFGGTVEVESEVGVGTVFTVKLNRA